MSHLKMTGESLSANKKLVKPFISFFIRKKDLNLSNLIIIATSELCATMKIL